MKRDSDKVAEVDYEDEDELTELEQQHADEEIYFEIFGNDDDLGFDIEDMLVIVPAEDVSEGENEGGG